jgi:NhaP-type Na+/H+ or K+/H+ antiporter
MDTVLESWFAERLTEIAAIISLFTAGLKLSLTACRSLGLPLGAAVLLRAIFTPTDPVLASDVQLTDPKD